MNQLLSTHTGHKVHLIVLFSLTNWGRDKMAFISRTTLSNEFSWMKMWEFWLKFHWNLFLRAQITNNPALVQIMAWRQAIIWTCDGQSTDAYMSHSASKSWCTYRLMKLPFQLISNKVWWWRCGRLSGHKLYSVYLKLYHQRLSVKVLLVQHHFEIH